MAHPPASGSQTIATGAGTTTKPWPSLLLPEGAGSWIPVAKLADLGSQALRFATDSIVGYLIQSDGDQGEKPGVIAISAACSHMGCIVQWQKTDRKYHCPCHGGLFSEYGKPDAASPLGYLTALPRLETRITRHGAAEYIEVRVPTSTQTTSITPAQRAEACLSAYIWTPPHLSVPKPAHCFGFTVRCIRAQ